MIGNANLQAKLLVDMPCATGEGPLWHPDEGRIYWTDIPGKRIYRCAADGGDLREFEMPEQVGGFTLQEDGALLLFMSRGAVKLWRGGEFLGTVVEEIPEERESRFNDIVADPRGRVFCGTMSSKDHPGCLYMLDTDGSIKLLVEGMKTPNGMGFSPDKRHFYQNDSSAAEMYRFRYDEETGEISGREVLIAVDANADEGRPDGMTVDAEGFLWTARWDGSRITRHSPDGAKILDVMFPVKKVSSLTIAGDDNRTAFMTTAGGGRRDENGALAGSLFVIEGMPAPGIPEFRSRVRV